MSLSQILQSFEYYSMSDHDLVWVLYNVEK